MAASKHVLGDKTDLVYKCKYSNTFIPDSLVMYLTHLCFILLMMITDFSAGSLQNKMQNALAY